jgi:hypothetical protein
MRSPRRRAAEMAEGWEEACWRTAFRAERLAWISERMSKRMMRGTSLENVDWVIG